MTSEEKTTGERLEVQRTIPADAAAIFRVLSDPQGHVAIDSSGMLMDATGQPVRAAGDTFVVHMDREALNDVPMGKYDVTVNITTLVPDREKVDESTRAAERALAPDPKLAEAEAVLGTDEHHFNWNWDEAEQERRKT